MKNFFLVVFLCAFHAQVEAQVYARDSTHSPLAHTYSIVARDSLTGEMGVAVQSHWFSVGSVVAWAEAGAGAVATQSFVNVSFGKRGLELLKSGKTPQQVVDELIASDEGRDVRQLAIINSKGVAVYTGKKCIQAAGHRAGKNYAVQANMMLNDQVPAAMSNAFESSRGTLAERMIAALEAAQKVGGDIRGQQSAAIQVVKGQSSSKTWEDKLIDLRVEDHPTPVAELKRLLSLHRAYDHMNAGDLAAEKGDMVTASKEYGAAEQLFPDNVEMKFWHAVTLTNNGKVDEAMPLFKQVFEKDTNWTILLQRLPQTGLLHADEKTLQRILSVKK